MKDLRYAFNQLIALLEKNQKDLDPRVLIILKHIMEEYSEHNPEK
jgi:hypothetical protein